MVVEEGVELEAEGSTAMTCLKCGTMAHGHFSGE